MKIFVLAKASSKNPRIERIDESHFMVAVKESPRAGKANKAIIKALSRFLHVPQSRIELMSGTTLKHKVLKVWG